MRFYAGGWGVVFGDINLIDKDSSWVIQSGKKGYIEDDINLDGQINNIDKNEFWLQMKEKDHKYLIKYFSQT